MDEIIRLYLKWENTQIPLKDYLTVNDEELIKRFISSENGKKALNLFSVSQQRELLRAYEDFKQQPHHDGAFNADEFIEMFLARNCG